MSDEQQRDSGNWPQPEGIWSIRSGTALLLLNVSQWIQFRRRVLFRSILAHIAAGDIFKWVLLSVAGELSRGLTSAPAKHMVERGSPALSKLTSEGQLMANCIRRKFVDVFDCAFDHSKARFPIMTMRAQKSGPRVFITGAIHGKETVGTEVINRIFKSVVLKRGTIYGIPAANMAGFIDGERRLPYGEPGMWDNLNSAFPGDSGGTPVERFAAAIYRTIILRKPDLVIDIHADSIHSIAFILLDRFIANPNPDLAAKTEALAKIFGITVCNDDTPDEYVHDGSQKTLTGALYNNAGIPAFVAELGGPILPDERFVQIGVNGIMNILDSMNMLKDPWRRVNAQKIEKPYPLRTQVIASDHASGKISYKITPGETVSRGQTIANIEDVFGKVVEVIEAPQHGIMLSLGYHPIAVPGVLIAIMAVRDKYK